MCKLSNVNLGANYINLFKNSVKILYSKDIGVIADKTGFTVTVGGSAGYNPRLSDIIAQDITEKQALDLVDNIFEFYKEAAEPGEKLGFLIDRIGIEKFKEELYKLRVKSYG